MADTPGMTQIDAVIAVVEALAAGKIGRIVASIDLKAAGLDYAQTEALIRCCRNSVPA